MSIPGLGQLRRLVDGLRRDLSHDKRSTTVLYIELEQIGPKEYRRTRVWGCPIAPGEKPHDWPLDFDLDGKTDPNTYIIERHLCGPTLDRLHGGAFTPGPNPWLDPGNPAGPAPVIIHRYVGGDDEPADLPAVEAAEQAQPLPDLPTPEPDAPPALATANPAAPPEPRPAPSPPSPVNTPTLRQDQLPRGWDEDQRQRNGLNGIASTGGGIVFPEGF
jgi:hypothetical protein